MARNSEIEAQRRELAQLIGTAPGGMTLDDITTSTSLALSRSTLIRRLNGLIRLGDITKEGRSKGARYYRPSEATSTVAPDDVPTRSGSYVPLSREGAKALKAVTRPMGARKPVGYDRAFLDRYRPNQSHYLSEPQRQHLAEIGLTTQPAAAAGTYAHAILQRLLIDLSWNSSRLEGNTYSLLDTQRLIELGETAEDKLPTDAQMILNHKAAIEFLVQGAQETAFDRRTILNLHALLADNLLPDPQAPGRLRTAPVGIAGSVFHPLAHPQLIDELFDSILATASAIDDPFEQAFFAMVHLPYLQPFDDVNKRVSRLAVNIPFIRNNLSPLSFVDMPDETYTSGVLAVYELNDVTLLRDVFMWAYERSAQRYAAIRQTLGEPDPFRLHHRSAIKTLVAEIVRQPMTKAQASRHIHAWAKTHLAGREINRFKEVVETELMSLHEGNFARYQIRPNEFDDWQAVWSRRA